VTFLFTDIEGSTRRWEADADAMRAGASHTRWGVAHGDCGPRRVFVSPTPATV